MVKTRNLLAIAISLLLVTTLTAAPVSQELAREQAGQFLQQRHGIAAARGMKLSEPQVISSGAAPSYYIFNIGQNEGFVLISGDDRTEPVLGYADEGSFCEDQMPQNLRAWLDGYRRQMQWLDKYDAETATLARKTKKAMVGVRTSISPLLVTRWDQNAPYNNLCPLNTSNVRTVTGCLATAISQLLYYYQKPAQTAKAIPAYTTETLKLDIDEKPVTSLQWDLMQESHTAGTTDEQDAAVATLMALVGCAFQMDYNIETKGGSSAVADNAPNVLADYFGYDPDAKMVYRNNYTYSDWINLIYRQLKNGHPVFYNGQSTGGGHAFLCDGYDEDDFFHINWGWGGRSNGYYRLSVLLPENQGAGGSANMSAFSYDQGIMINVNPENDGIDDTGRSRVSSTRIDGGGVGTYHRAAANLDFENVWINTQFFNRTGEDHTFDVGLGLFDEEENLKKVIWEQARLNIPYTRGFEYRVYPFFGEDVPDGSYRIVSISRLSDSQAEWMPSYDSEKHYLTATIEGNVLSLDSVNISADNALNLSATLALEGTAVKGQATLVVATVTNNSKSLYTGNLKLIRQGDDGYYYMLAGTQVDIEPEATIQVPFTFKPANAGLYNVILWDKATKNIATAVLPVNVSAGEAAVNANLVHVKTVLNNGDLETGQVFGSSVKATVTLRNDDTKDHTSGFFVWLFHWTPTGEGNYSGNSNVYQTVDVTIPAGETKDVDFEFKGLEPNTLYSFRYNYVDDIYNQVGIGSTELFESVVGITAYTADGASVISRPQTVVTVPNDVVAIDVSGVGITDITPNDNPNTLYIFGPDDEIPASLSDKNVVKGGEAEQLVLSDNFDFYSPVAFTVPTATYTRRFAVGADGTNGWSTIVVPFDVSEVRSGAKVIDWFHSSDDKGKHFWLKEFSGEADGVVLFHFADQLKAYTPYIIAVPGNKWGENWNLTNRNIDFKGTDVKIPADAKAVVNCNTFKLVGTTRGLQVENDYLLNANGNAFEKQASATLGAFRACFRPVGYLSSSVLPIGQEDSHATGLWSTDNPTTASGKVYNLQGIPMDAGFEALPKGIYIVHGKKIIK